MIRTCKVDNWLKDLGAALFLPCPLRLSCGETVLLDTTSQPRFCQVFVEIIDSHPKTNVNSCWRQPSWCTWSIIGLDHWLGDMCKQKCLLEGMRGHHPVLSHLTWQRHYCTIVSSAAFSLPDLMHSFLSLASDSTFVVPIFVWDGLVLLQNIERSQLLAQWFLIFHKDLLVPGFNCSPQNRWNLCPGCVVNAEMAVSDRGIQTRSIRLHNYDGEDMVREVISSKIALYTCICHAHWHLCHVPLPSLFMWYFQHWIPQAEFGLPEAVNL